MISSSLQTFKTPPWTPWRFLDQIRRIQAEKNPWKLLSNQFSHLPVLPTARCKLKWAVQPYSSRHGATPAFSVGDLSWPNPSMPTPHQLTSPAMAGPKCGWTYCVHVVLQTRRQYEIRSRKDYITNVDGCEWNIKSELYNIWSISGWCSNITRRSLWDDGRISRQKKQKEGPPRCDGGLKLPMTGQPKTVGQKSTMMRYSVAGANI